MLCGDGRGGGMKQHVEFTKAAYGDAVQPVQHSRNDRETFVWATVYAAALAAARGDTDQANRDYATGEADAAVVAYRGRQP